MGVSTTHEISDVSRRYRSVPTPVDDVLLLAEGEWLIGLYFANHRIPESEWGSLAGDDDPVLSPAVAQLDEYFAGLRQDFDLPLLPRGGALAESIWRLLLDIPYGTTTSYGAIATQLGDRSLAQQVGQAVGRNPIAIIIPCHRVIGADGSLTGFGGGLERKRILLSLEEPSAEDAGRLF
ncbi:MAG: methylated-DNA--[protein]-cysteine S-methyltransferase [Gordonia polyisoprenivorans]|nr:methylated-DNA--[protein]-cysteine S-methyltransferase [Gordonia polyisoprenivorans]